MFKPHFPQNFEEAGSVAEHCGQENSCLFSPSLITAKERFPQRPQNFTPSAKRALQFVQRTIPGIKLDFAVPVCEDEGWLFDSRRDFNFA